MTKVVNQTYKDELVVQHVGALEDVRKGRTKTIGAKNLKNAKFIA